MIWILTKQGVFVFFLSVGYIYIIKLYSNRLISKKKHTTLRLVQTSLCYLMHASKGRINQHLEIWEKISLKRWKQMLWETIYKLPNISASLRNCFLLLLFFLFPHKPKWIPGYISRLTKRKKKLLWKLLFILSLSFRRAVFILIWSCYWSGLYTRWFFFYVFVFVFFFVFFSTDFFSSEMVFSAEEEFILRWSF